MNNNKKKNYYIYARFTPVDDRNEWIFVFIAHIFQIFSVFQTFNISKVNFKFQLFPVIFGGFKNHQLTL